MKKPTIYLPFVTMLLLAVAAISGCTGNTGESAETAAASTFDLATAKTEIIAANSDFSKFFAAKDSAGVAGLYAADAKFMVEGAPAISGRSNIQSAFSGFINSGMTRVDLKTIEVWGSEGLVTEEGEYTLYAGDQEADHGKYLVLWKKEDGQWHLFRDIFNTDVPPAK